MCSDFLSLHAVPDCFGFHASGYWDRLLLDAVRDNFVAPKYTVGHKKRDSLLLSISALIINRFKKNFYLHTVDNLQ